MRILPFCPAWERSAAIFCKLMSLRIWATKTASRAFPTWKSWRLKYGIGSTPFLRVRMHCGTRLSSSDYVSSRINLWPLALINQLWVMGARAILGPALTLVSCWFEGALIVRSLFRLGRMWSTGLCALQALWSSGVTCALNRSAKGDSQSLAGDLEPVLGDLGIPRPRSLQCG